MNFLTSGKVPKRTGTAHPNIQPQDVFDCKDGQVVLALEMTVSSSSYARC
jgi:crotonobetainyl-CoA:carnitine CoA-transferase CaiB-like acyl-CoA transferase